MNPVTAERKTRDWTSFLGLLLVALLLAPFVGCETTIGRIHATTFPPDLSYIPPERVKSAMWILAAEVQELEHLLGDRDANRDVPNLRFATAATLERMRVAARSLERGGRSTQHPVLNENLDAFIGRLERAERALDRDPPDYFPASTIAGSCFLCHGQKRTA